MLILVGYHLANRVLYSGRCMIRHLYTQAKHATGEYQDYIQLLYNIMALPKQIELV